MQETLTLMDCRKNLLQDIQVGYSQLRKEPTPIVLYYIKSCKEYTVGRI